MQFLDKTQDITQHPASINTQKRHTLPEKTLPAVAVFQRVKGKAYVLSKEQIGPVTIKSVEDNIQLKQPDPIKAFKFIQHKQGSTRHPSHIAGNKTSISFQLKPCAGNPGVIQREPGDGKELLDDLTNPGWMPKGSKTYAGKEAITGAELKLLMKGAVESAWKTYAYHATKSANVESIISKGLDPRRGGTGAAAGSDAFEEHSRGHVHYTRKLGLAEDYKAHFEGHTPFGRKVEQPEAAEVLQVAIPKDIGGSEEIDPDSKAYDQAYRTRSGIPGKFIRRIAPVPIPPSRKMKGTIKPGENEIAWAEHVIRGQAETSALLSNMPYYATNIMYDMMKKGLDVETMLLLIKQGLRSMSTDAILEMTLENRQLNPRLYQNRMDPTGRLLPFRL